MGKSSMMMPVQYPLYTNADRSTRHSATAEALDSWRESAWQWFRPVAWVGLRDMAVGQWEESRV